MDKLMHQFLFTSSLWLGQGKIQLNMISEELAFFTRWNAQNADGTGRIECLQEIQVKGLSDVMCNEFLIYNLNASGEFSIDLENQALGRVTGTGLINEKVIAWEFRIEEIGFEGFELYEKQDENNYLIRAEYATSDQFRTLIQGRLWKQTT
jgi:hypothetical protein